MIKKIGAVIGGILLPALVGASPIPAGMTYEDLNTLIAAEATQNTIAALALSLEEPIPRQRLGKWSGTIDSHGWSLTFSGQLNGRPLSYQTTGELDLLNEKATWIDAGMLGFDAITGSGEMLIDPTWFQTIAIGIFGGTIAGIQAITTAGSGGTGLFVSALTSSLVIAVGGKIIEENYRAEVVMSRKFLNAKDRVLRSTGNLTNPAFQARLGQFGRHNIFDKSTSFVTSIPEPPILALMGLGLAGIGYYRRGEALK